MDCPNCKKYNNVGVVTNCWNCGENLTEYFSSTYEQIELDENIEVIQEKFPEDLGQNKIDQGLESKQEDLKEIIVDQEVEVDNYITGVSLLSSAFLVLVQIIFWLSIVGSLYLMVEVSFIYGIITILSSVISCNIIFILGDILQNIAELNKKIKG